MSTLTKETRLADLVTEHPASAALLDQLGIDFCCGGDVPLQKAAEDRGLDSETLVAALEALDAVKGGGGAHDVQAMTDAELIDHIVDVHHTSTREQLRWIADMFEAVISADGAGDSALEEMRERFTKLSEDLTEHMRVEEDELFPALRAAAAGGGPAASGLIEGLSEDHEVAGGALEELREIGGGYDLSSARSETHRLLMQSLAEFEADLHIHIHEENNVLFPRLRGEIVGK